MVTRTTPLWEWEELEITHFKGSGPGGQNRNKRMTGVRVVHLPTGIVAAATERRSQFQNLEQALARLDEKLAARLVVAKKRFKTKPTKSSQRKRLDIKKQHSAQKRSRQKSWSEGS